MGETKENRRARKPRNKKEKATIGDIVFRVLIVVAIFFIAIIAYAMYITGVA